METANLDILCFGAHPDDVEIGMGGTIAKHIDLDYRVGICDLTMAELSSNGTREERQQEAKQAAKILGVEKRINLEFPDRGLDLTAEKIEDIVRIIRQHKPRVVFLPYEDDRHPDHGRATKLVEEAIFNAGIRKYHSGSFVTPHRVEQTYYYFINGFSKPNLLIDISAYMETKIKALLAYQTQFSQQTDTVQTRLNTGFIEVIEGRERLFGKMKDVSFAEGFMSKEPLILTSFLPELTQGWSKVDG